MIRKVARLLPSSERGPITTAAPVPARDGVDVPAIGEPGRHFVETVRDFAGDMRLCGAIAPARPDGDKPSGWVIQAAPETLGAQ